MRQFPLDNQREILYNKSGDGMKVDGKDVCFMKRKLFCLAAALCIAAGCCGAIPAEAASAAVSSERLKENYAMWRQSALYDDGMLKEYIREMLMGQEPPDGYFFNTGSPLSEEDAWYDSSFIAGYGGNPVLYANIPTSKSAVFFTKSQAEITAAEEILQTYAPDPTGRSYSHSQNRFTLNIHDPETLDAIRDKLTEADLIACFYDCVPVYEHRTLTVPYLTCYFEVQEYSTAFEGKLTAEYLQSYLDEHALNCYVRAVEWAGRLLVIPEERISLREHWALAVQLYHDLGIVPDMTTDIMSEASHDPITGAGVLYDINTDTFFDAGDVRSLNDFLLYEGETEDPQAGDMDSDGRFSAADLTLMKRALLAKQNKPEEVLPPPPVQVLEPSMPSIGTNRIPVFAAEFPDCAFPEFVDIAGILHSRCFSATDLEYPDYPFESIAGYYERASYGRMKLTGNVFRYMAKHPIDWYAADYAKSLVDEMLTALDPLLDYRDYDTDGNNVLDSIIIVLPDAALKKDSDSDNMPDWWPFSIDAYSEKTYDGVRVGKYCVAPYDPLDAKEFVKQMAHELGHAMGLPDYYQYATETTSDKDGLIGNAGKELMDDGEGDLSAFSKMMLGWVTEDEIQVYTGGTQTFYLKAAQDAPGCVLIPRDPTAGLLSEYFLIEYVVPSGNHPEYNGSGIRILHAEAEVSEGDFGPELTYYNYGKHYDTSHQKQRVLRLVNDNGNFYPGNKDVWYKDTVDGDTEGFHWYDADGNLTVDPGLTVKIDTCQRGPFYDPDSSDPTAWINGIAQITVSEAGS